jgi:hypothetical protein
MHQQPRIYISCRYDPRRRFLDHARQSLREGILQCVREQGFEPQEFGVSGLPQGSDWDFARARDVMLQCDGALVIAIAQWFTEEGGIPVPVPSEYSHFEGALAIGARIPLLVISEETMVPRASSLRAVRL